MTRKPQIYLASRSPRRRELLSQIGIDYQLVDIEVDERLQSGELPLNYVQRLAADKAQAGLDASIGGSYLPVLAADTSVVVKGEVFGKPENRDHGVWMLRQLSGNVHQVYSAVALCAEAIEIRVSISQVIFRAMSEVEIQAYWDTGEPVDKAGGYGIQGVGAQFVKRLEGSYSGVMGLPLFETAELLRHVGIEPVKPT
ncbi:MAG: Maf family protein [Candidatus Thiodiazotropha sp.]|jgi:septum formation protein